MKSGIVICTVCLCALAAVAAPPGGGMKMPKAVVGVGTVVETEDMESRRYTGLIVAEAEVRIVPRVSGEILEIGFKDGENVRKGQTLYRLDPVQYHAAVKNAEAKIAECEAKLSYAKNNYDRNQTLYTKNAISKDTMENTLSTLRGLEASLLAAKAELIVAQDNLKNTTITAPMDGAAGVGALSEGNYVTPSTGTLVNIIRMRPIRVRFSISMGDYLSMFGSLKNLKDNGSVRIRLADGSLYPAEGEIELLNNEANRKTDAIQIYVRFPNQDRKLMPGSTVAVTLSKKKGVKVAAILPSAVMHDSEGAFVYVPDAGNKIEKRYIVTGNATDTLQMIRSGLKAGERVVVTGTHKTRPNGEIMPIPVK